MKKTILAGDVSPKCAYCRHCIPTADSSISLCEKKGVVDPAGACKKFLYDPLKRIPEKPVREQLFSDRDFSL